ncbi:MAG: helix-turn-helix domain-containing protein [Clostridiales bacterium]|nr:helix-turn-helix domain-containing protein [Clostridiales bacterium]
MRKPEENGQALYSVSEAVQRSGVPSHVLRYWEEELGLSIRRTAQGHRVYSEEDLETFRKVKDLKEKGIQLKAIRLLFAKTEEGVQLSELLGERPYERTEDTKPQGADVPEDSKPQGADVPEDCGEPDGEAVCEIIPKSETGTYRLFEAMLRSLISDALSAQNEKLEAEIADLIRDEIEELYIQLQQDMAEKEAAASQTSPASESGRRGLLQRMRRMFAQKEQEDSEKRKHGIR